MASSLSTTSLVPVDTVSPSGPIATTLPPARSAIDPRTSMRRTARGTPPSQVFAVVRGFGYGPKSRPLTKAAMSAAGLDQSMLPAASGRLSFA